jgi:hypothetical protein
LGARPQLSHLLEKKGDRSDTSEEVVDAMMANIDHLQLRHSYDHSFTELPIILVLHFPSSYHICHSTHASGRCFWY